MVRLSIQARQALSRLVLPGLVLAALAVTLLARVAPGPAQQLRAVASDAVAPAYSLVGGPASGVRDMLATAVSVLHVAHENAELRAENARLRRWYDAAQALATENVALRAQLHWLPQPEPSFVTARVVADTGGLYDRAVLLSVGPNSPVQRGQIALDASGLVGRVSQLGSRSARILLITDATSRVPVMLADSHARAIVLGTNAAWPRLMYYPQDVMPKEGERVVTSAEAGAFPAGLPVGTVHYDHPGTPVVIPAASLDSLDLVRIFDYGLTSILPPDAPGRAHAAETETAPPDAPRAAAPAASHGLLGIARANAAGLPFLAHLLKPVVAKPEPAQP
ncbi:rod shape-determining protein MreC [Endobacter medicaginis]|uniref:Cell shape-determining protein MreC n=2 Tax=Endobacter medicaginis TaxID=1181271 RepID=A0A839UZW4_9PROT|nr:rod shape-determining protein MreC [Endobacter medicaginis]MCX5474428.1 rod shape-determining protein MreC [Endobacter medicaginis]